MPDLYIMPASLERVPWSQRAEQIERACVDLRIGWGTIDTFFAVAGLGGELENQAGAVDEAMAPVKRIAGKLDVAVTLTRHTRKSGGEIGESGRGSSAATGGADFLVDANESRASPSSSRRSLEISGRL